jgi:hypothetical protein
MKSVVIFSHAVIGILLVANSDVLIADDDELGHLVKDHLERHYPDLLKNIDLEGYELVTVIRLTDSEVKIEIMGDDGVVHIQGDLLPVWHMIDRTKNEPLAVLADGQQAPSPADHVGLRSPKDLDDMMRTV